MKSCWEHIRNDDSIVIGRDETFSEDRLRDELENLINLTKYNFTKWTYTKSQPYQCIIESESEYIEIVLYLANITNAGWEDRPHKKRAQVTNVKELNLKFSRYSNMSRMSLILGYYNFEKPIFVSWDARKYQRHKSNRSCYVDVEDLLRGYQLGYVELIRSKNPIQVFTPSNVDKWMEKQFEVIHSDISSISDLFAEISFEMYKIISEFENIWDGREKVIEMRDGGGRNWRQSEWQGWYFEYIMQQILDVKFTKIKFNNTVFDYFDSIPWDFKVHSTNKASRNSIPANDLSAVYASIKEFGEIGFIILEGEAIYEPLDKFEKWHDKIKGREISENKEYLRKRKSAFKPERLSVIVLGVDDIEEHPKFQEGMINSNDKKRNSKLMIDLRKLKNKNIILQRDLKK